MGGSRFSVSETHPPRPYSRTGTHPGLSKVPIGPKCGTATGADHLREPTTFGIGGRQLLRTLQRPDQFADFGVELGAVAVLPKVGDDTVADGLGRARVRWLPAVDDVVVETNRQQVGLATVARFTSE